MTRICKIQILIVKSFYNTMRLDSILYRQQRSCKIICKIGYTLANLRQSTYFNLFYHSTSYSHDAAGPQTLGAQAAWALDVENLITIAWVNSHSRTPKIRSAPPRGGGEQGGSAPPRQDRPGGEQKSAMGGSTWEGKSKP